jgi:hypothetical protein
MSTARVEGGSVPLETPRLSPPAASVVGDLRLLGDLAGTWSGEGFNLIGRPDHEGNATVYLQLNRTRETLKLVPIGSPVPNRGRFQDDIELFGLTYLQRITDAANGGALHIEPGIWVVQPATTHPAQNGPNGAEIVTRMGSVPHGNAFVAQGLAETFSGPPTLTNGDTVYAFSRFPSFNSTAFPTSAFSINASGSSDRLTAKAAKAVPFTPYDLTIPTSSANPRTPFRTTPPDPPLPNEIDGVPMQDVLNDPIRLLQQVIQRQHDAGFSFDGTVINIATRSPISFLDEPNQPLGKAHDVEVPNGSGSLGNIPFLASNANAALMYATFWVERVSYRDREPFMQLQYAQMTILEFPPLPSGHKPPNFAWPHVSVATLRKSFVG